jgi:hypothetical protein
MIWEGSFLSRFGPPICLGALMLACGIGSNIAKAGGGPHPDLTCSKATPCFERDNTGSGGGISGIALHNDGVTGTTSLANNATQFASGVLGIDAGTANSSSGVLGTSKNGVGVTGTSSVGPGVVGISSTAAAAVYGASSGGGIGRLGLNGVGVLGSGQIGVQGVNSNSSSSDALLANGSGGRLFRGVGSGSVGDVFTVGDNGDVSTRAGLIGSTATIDGTSDDWTCADRNLVPVQVFAEGTTEGLEADSYLNLMSTGTIFAYEQASASASVFVGNSSNGFDVFTVDVAGNVHAHSFTADLASVRQRTALGSTVLTYPTQSSVPVITDIGEAQLVDGHAHVIIDSKFASAMDIANDYLVFVDSEGENGGLYVSQRTRSGFDVAENHGGRSTTPFSYRVVARPLGSVAMRLPISAPFANVKKPKLALKKRGTRQ